MITARQRQLLSFIEGYQARTGGVSPSFREMADHLDIASNAGVFNMLERLEERGFIRRLPYRARAIKVLEAS